MNSSNSPEGKSKKPPLFFLGCLVAPFAIIFALSAFMVATNLVFPGTFPDPTPTPVAIVAPTINQGRNTAMQPGKSSSTTGGAIVVSRAQMGAAWPLSVADGAVSCQGSRDAGALFFEREGKRWALNGTALTGGRTPDIADSGFLVPDSRIKGSFKSVTPLMDAARDACSE